jgi:hypothetical protein
MNFLKNIFSKAHTPISSNEDFWNWFIKNEKTFFKIVKTQSNIEKDFFDKLSTKLNELKEGFLYLTGMIDDDTAELIFTADGEIKNFVFVEELVNTAPQIKGWKFTALKPQLGNDDFEIRMSGYTFSTENIYFYANDVPNLPDEIDITVVYENLTEENRSNVLNGVFIFLENYVGELNFATLIDNVAVIGKNESEKELVPINKLSSFLIWREKEFIEKYEDVKINTENQSHSILQGESRNGHPLFAAINTDLLAWDNKASHPWILKFELLYDGSENDGLPDDYTFELLSKCEDDMLLYLKDMNGHLHIGRESSESVRSIYFACNEFRECSKIANTIQHSYTGILDITYEIYKDKYWQSLAYFEQ